ncbi:protein lin-54 homolog isoform X4 [Epinephelus fuscoguttatus]|nr:protein lin-54 homolog isoform X4 [Epinephelus fuscoguttatus]
MNITELDTTQNKQEYMDIDGHSSNEKDRNVNPGPAGTPLWTKSSSDVSLPRVVPHPHHSDQPGMEDPLTLRFHCPCPSTQCQLSHSDYLTEPQSSQYDLLTGPVPGPQDSSHHSSVSAPLFTKETILCSMMPVVCNVSGDGQVVLVNPCEPGPVFLTLTSKPAQREDGPTQGEDVGVLGTSSQLPQYLQTACPLYECRDQTTNMQPKAPPVGHAGALCESKSRKPCHCSRSLCLKLYCECFASGVMCSNCDCSNCHNNAEHEMNRQKAIKSCLGRNPEAFRSKRSGEVKGWHNKGCNCKRSGCLKNYCECYEANIMCTSSCKCVGCRNYDDSSEMGLKEKNKWPVSLITSAVVEAACGCLLAQAEEAESEAQSLAQAERMVLVGFSHCLTQIIKAMFKKNAN